MDKAIKNRPHGSECALDMVHFIWGDMQRQVQDGFSILLSTEYDVRLFREKLKFSCIAAIPQAHCRPCLILNLSDQPNKETPSFNSTTDRDIVSESM